MEISRVAVVGAGIMGRGVAQALAQAGFAVVLLDLNQEILEQARLSIRQSLRFQALFQETYPAGDADQVFERIVTTVNYDHLSKMDFVIENATENIDIKKDVFNHLDAICPENCILASNTSAIPITQLASLTSRPHQVIGIHFMNPVHLISTVEVICGEQTSQATLITTQDLLTRLGKDWILVKDSPGFVSNRVLMIAINEAIFLLREGVATAEQVDHLFKACFGHKMGPLETADLIGLDTVLYSIEVLHRSFQDDKYRPCPLLIEMVSSGLLGQKSGKGFYQYPMELETGE